MCLHIRMTLLGCVALWSGAAVALAEDSVASKWLAAAPATPEFHVPRSLDVWKVRRLEVRAKLWELLGQLPPRPEKVEVTTISREDRGDYFLEKFDFDNLAGDRVPGYLLLPKADDGKPQMNCPGVLYCHWHG